jgi:hypothetical protein
VPRSRTVQSIAANREPSDDEDIPEWAKPQREPDSAPAEAPIEGQVTSATPALNNLLEWLVAESNEDSESAMGMEAIVRQALSAPDVASVLRKTLPISASNFVDVPMLLLDFTIRESEFEGESSLPYYASLQVMMGEPPEPRVVNTGSISILAQLKRLRELDEWPQVVMIVEATKAKKGQSPPLRLAQIDIVK